jgi:hypothetical protein
MPTEMHGPSLHLLGQPHALLAVSDCEVFDIRTMCVPDGELLFGLARRITPNIANLLPRNVNRSQVHGH